MLIKVAIVDDHPILINGLKSVLSNTSFIKITGSYLTGKELLEGLKGNCPDLLLLDIYMPDQNGDELAALVHKQYPEIKILAFTNSEQQYYIKSMLQNGVKGYILKSSDEFTLLEGIKTVYEGKQFFDDQIKHQAIEAIKQEKRNRYQQPTLTEREKEVLQLIAQNLSSQEIAEKLFITKRTVDFHRANLLLKLEAKNTNALISKSVELGLVK